MDLRKHALFSALLVALGGCESTTTTAGPSSLVAVSVEPAGPNCAHGGQRIDDGTDDDGNGTLDAAEIEGTVYVCNGGAGQQTLVALADEPAGANCANEGTRIEYGLDDSGDGVLQAGEIDGTSYVCVPSAVATAPAAPVGCYSFEGDATDGSGLGNDGTLQGGTSFIAGLHGQAVQIDGTDGFVSLPPLASQDFSIAGWIYYAATPGGWSRFFEQSKDASYPSTGSMFVTLNDGSNAMVGRVWDSTGLAGATTPTTPTPSAGVWHHIAYTYDQGGAGMALYVDGALVSWDDYSAEGFDDWGTQILNLGRSSWPADPDVYVAAAYDEVFVYDRALSHADIGWLYNFGLGCDDIP